MDLYLFSFRRFFALVPLLCISSFFLTAQPIPREQVLKNQLATATPQDSSTLLVGIIRSSRDLSMDSVRVYGRMLIDFHRRHRDTTGINMGYYLTTMMLQQRGYYQESLDLLDEVWPVFEAPPFDSLGPLYGAMRHRRGEALAMLGQTDAALKDYYTALYQWRKQDHPFKAGLYQSVGRIHASKGTYDSAIHYYQLKVDIDLRQKQEYSAASGMADIADVYRTTGRYAEALELQQRALKLQYQSDDPLAYIYGLENMCTLRSEMNGDSVRYYCQAAIKEAETYNTYTTIDRAATALADYYVSRGGQQDSIGYYFKKAFSAGKQLPIDLNFINKSTRYGSYLLQTGNPAAAHDILHTTLLSHRENPQLEFPNQGQLYLALARSEVATSRNDSAAVHLAKGLALLEADYERKSQLSVAEATASYQVEEAQYATQQERFDRVLAERKNEEQQRMILLGGGGGLLLLLLGGGFYLRLSRDRKMIARKNEQLAIALNERGILLKEIHHRVKNNLQIISGLLYKQARISVSEDVRATLQGGQDRIHAMALVHQSLYQREELTYINARDFVAELTGQLKISQASTSQKVVMKVDVADEELNMDQAIPIGLILNELVTNAYKYAFKPNKRDAELSIEFQRVDMGKNYELRVADNGSGLPEGYELRSQKGLGLNLVRGLARQLGGTWRITNLKTGGTAATVRFSTVRPNI
ncbi:tetratricopeptide repeat protein [Neolewinella aurantiaca]|uniref:histidine kinase n=1 Tax=Neolewinella aurantiaca TaxID=2602767 RepID=A0A5C7FFK5_9BACT|nr:histidine kinase dimerization/phosphoacceptor domain -containing protein [Neolewinella aurantiaca]TXF89058.1 tetratricopeptide repeat protein [Neolewinella aurantiaca]